MLIAHTDAEFGQVVVERVLRGLAAFSLTWPHDRSYLSGVDRSGVCPTVICNRLIKSIENPAEAWVKQLIELPTFIAVALYDAKGFKPNGKSCSMPPPRQHIRERQRDLRLA